MEKLDITDYGTGDCKREFTQEELVIFGIPVFGGRVPAPAVEKIKQLKGMNTPTVLIAVFGNRDFDDALLELKDLSVSRGFVPAAAVMAVAEHSIMRRFAAGRPDEADEKVLRRFGEEIMQRLHTIPSSVQITGFEIPGKRPYCHYDGVPFKPKAGKKCNTCGLCAKHCPVNAIPLENPSDTDKSRCISCMRCIAVCPSHARSLNAIKLFAAEKVMWKKFQEYKENVLFM